MNCDKFQVWDADVPEELSAWLALWNQWPEREVSAHPAYGALFLAPGDRLMCASYITPANGAILYPFVHRDLSDLPIAHGLERPIGDITTPYGYGGPQTWGLVDAEAVSLRFWARFDQWLDSQNIVTEFIRFSLFSESLLDYPGEKVSRMRNIVRSLGLDVDAIWMNFEQKVRKNVKKAQRSGIRVEVDETGEYLADFMRIYQGTMERRDADPGYYFPLEFFEAIHSELAGQYAYFHAYHEGKIVSTELVLVSERSVYSFLGGTESSAFDYRPNDLLKYEIIRWASARGKANFVLGGGATPEDGIERYKRSIAPRGAVDFVTGQRILRPDLNTRLTAARQMEFENAGRAWPEFAGYFPPYRLPM